MSGGNGHSGNGHSNGNGTKRGTLSDPLRAMEPFPTAHMLLDKYGLRDYLARVDQATR